MDSVRATGKPMVCVAVAGARHASTEKVGPPRILGESHLGLRVTDLDRSARFFIEVLGFREVVRNPHQSILTCGSWTMALYDSVRRDHYVPVEEPHSRTCAGLHHLAFALGSGAEVDAAAGWLDAQEVPRRQVRDGFTPGSRFVTFYDPDGIALEYYFLDSGFADAYGLATTEVAND